MSNKASPNKRMKNLTDFFSNSSNSTQIKPIKKKIIRPIKKYQLVLEESKIEVQVLRRRKASIIKLEQNLKKNYGKIAEDSKMNDTQAKKLAAIIKSSQKGQKLNLDFTASKKITSVGFRCIFKSLRFPHLKILNLNFFECNGITKLELSRLYKALTKFPRIKVLALSFERCWKRYFDNGLDNGLLHLGETLQKLRTLRNLNLNFGDCSLKDQVLCNIGRNLQRLRLQDFALNLNDCSSLTYQEQKMFCEDLAKMKSLQGLNLSLQSINGANFIYLLAHAIKNLVYLRNLKLNFDWQKSLQGHFYLQIKEILQVLPYLQNVNFSFRANDWITDNVLKDLSEGFRDAVSLKSVKLNFRMFKRITLVSLGDKSGLEDLSQTLRNMPGLEYIEIDLSVCGLSKKAQDEFKRPFDALKRCRTNIIFRHKVDD